MSSSVRELIGKSRHIQAIRTQVEAWSGYDEPVLIAGESGTGKELVARAVHASSRRAAEPLHVVNCAALAPDVLMAELFGHVRGAYTGAVDSRPGRLRQADGATLLLDEITESSPELQSALLRVIEQGEVQPVGSDRVIRVDVRILATTNRSEAELCDGHCLRRDLLYRLGAFVVKLDPLRRRRDDIAPLAQMFLREIGAAQGRAFELSRNARTELEAAALPGNARELRQVLLRAAAACPDGVIHTLAVRDAMAAGLSPRGEAGDTTAGDTGHALADVIRGHIAATLDATRGNLSEAARRLDVPRSTLQHYLVRYGIDRKGERQSRTRSA